MPPGLIEWLETISVAQLLTAFTSVGAVGLGVKWVKPIAEAAHHFANDWAGEPDRPGVPGRPGVMARLDSMQDEIREIREDTRSAAYHTKPNGGGSAHDDVMKAILRLSERLDQSIEMCAADRAALHHTIETDDVQDS